MRTATTILAISLAALLAVGSVTLYSAVMTTHPARFTTQIMYLGLGLLGAIILGGIDYRRWKGWIVWVPYVVSVVLLILVFAPVVGVERGGSNRWVRLGGFQIQPSEMAKLALILAFAAFAERYQRRMNTWKVGLLGTGLVVGPVLGLILIEVDLSTTAALSCIMGVLWLIAGVRWIHVAPVVLVAVIGLSVYVAGNDVRRGRITAYLEPQHFAQSTAYQNDRAARAMAIGNLLGVGAGDSPLKENNYVPLAHSDFIFSVVATEGGLVATTGTLLLFLTFFCCGIYIAFHARDMFGMLVATGITFSIALQAFVHMGVVSGLLPNTGFPLPFFSHGGTNLVVNLLAVGLLFSIARRAVARVKSKNPFERHVDVPVAGVA